MLLSLTNVGFSYGNTRILENLNLAIENQDRIALIGPNGAGKTTLLNIICGIYENDEGEIFKKSGLRIGYLKQSAGLSSDGTIESEMTSSLGRVFQVEKDLLNVSDKIAQLKDHESNEYKELSQKYQKLDEEFTSLDGYNARVKINSILTGMGFSSFDRSTKVSTLSGGEKTRLMLCKLLAEEPDLLVLDEATNHLDFKTLGWLEDYLNSYKGAILTVSHDRFFLDNVTTITWEIENLTIVKYPASYTKFLVLRQERLTRIEKEYEKYQREVAELQEYVDKNLVRASTTKMAQSRQKMIERLDAPKPPVPIRSPKFSFKARVRPVLDILDVSNVLVTPDGKNMLIDDLNFHVRRGDRLGIIGENGTGKSTLLNILNGKGLLYRGKIEWGKNVSVSYYTQDAGDLTGNENVMDNLWSHFPALSQFQIRSALGLVDLVGDDVLKSVSSLSGGEKARIKFTVLHLEESNVLVLDEPTNHLDIPSKEALEDALLNYDGTVIVVSHDRRLLSKIPTRILFIKDKKATCYEGNYTNIREIIEEKPVHVVQTKVETDEGIKFHKSKAQRSQEAANKKRISFLEEEINRIEKEISQSQEKMSSPEIVSDYEKLTEVSNNISELQKLLDSYYEEWAELN